LVDVCARFALVDFGLAQRAPVPLRDPLNQIVLSKDAPLGGGGLGGGGEGEDKKDSRPVLVDVQTGPAAAVNDREEDSIAVQENTNVSVSVFNTLWHFQQIDRNNSMHLHELIEIRQSNDPRYYFPLGRAWTGGGTCNHINNNLTFIMRLKHL